MHVSVLVFAGKYEALREQMKCKEMLALKAEAQCDLRDESLISLRDERRAQLVALQRTLGEIARDLGRMSRPGAIII